MVYQMTDVGNRKTGNKNMIGGELNLKFIHIVFKDNTIEVVSVKARQVFSFKTIYYYLQL